MCWINWFSFWDEDLIQAMNKKIIHRWPDGNWFFVNDKISLWQVRLSIIDLSNAGNQPLFYSKDIWSFYYNEKQKIFEDINHNIIDVSKLSQYYAIVFNWEIYNFHSIKDKLIKKWYIFTTKTDTEVILAAYSEYWNNCHDLFDGMWAYCIYDIKDNKLIFSRDRFWIKPLYYYIDENQNIIFSSEIKWILEYNWYKREPNEEMIFRYLYLKNDTDIKQTFFNNIYKFPNAHFWCFDLNTKNFDISRYRDLNIYEDFSLSKKEAIENTKSNLFNSVKLHKISDVDVWCCLSWWIDSSSIACSLKYLNLINNKDKLKTFSSIFKWENADESYYIDIVRKNINCESFFTSPSWEDLRNDIEDLVYYQEEPFIWTSMYIQYKVMELAHKNWIKVTLDWQWWDEVFWWYNTFYPYHLLYLLKKWRIKKFIKYLVWMKKYYSNSLFKWIVFPLLYLWYLILPSRIKKLYLRLDNVIVKDKYINKYKNISLHEKYNNSIDKFYYYHQMENIQHLLRYWDKNSMRWWVESRVPFLEKELVEFVWKIPFDLKIPNWLPKYILRESMKGIIPDEIKNRYDKKWFETPESKRLRTDWMKKYIKEIFSAKILFIEQYVNINKFNQILSEFFDWNNKYCSLVRYALNLELWGKTFFYK